MIKSKITKAVIFIAVAAVVVFGVGKATQAIRNHSNNSKEEYNDDDNSKTTPTEKVTTTEILTPTPEDNKTPTPTTDDKIIKKPTPKENIPTPTQVPNGPEGTMYVDDDGITPSFYVKETVAEGQAKGYRTVTTETTIYDVKWAEIEGQGETYNSYTIKDIEYFDEDGNSRGHDCTARDTMGYEIWRETLENGIEYYNRMHAEEYRNTLIECYYEGEFDMDIVSDTTVTGFKDKYSGSQGRREFNVGIEFTILTMDDSNPRFEFVYHVTYDGGTKIKLFDRVYDYPESDFLDLKEQYDKGNHGDIR